MANSAQNKAIHASSTTKRGTADGYMIKKDSKGVLRTSGSGKANPFAASNPYAKGRKLKPKGAPAPYSKEKQGTADNDLK